MLAGAPVCAVPAPRRLALRQMLAYACGCVRVRAGVHSLMHSRVHAHACAQVLERLKEQGRALQRSATGSVVEKRAVYHQAMDAEKQLATLRKSMQILETTMNNIENTAVMQRLHRVMQDTMARHQQITSQHSEENALHSEVTQAFDQLTNDVQSGINSMDEMSTNIDIMAAQDPLHAQKLTEAQWFSALEPAAVRQTGLAETGANARALAPSEQSVSA